YYEQALCLKRLKSTHPDICLRLFAASSSRLRELSVLDFSFADSFTLWNTMTEYSFDEFHQFQANDRDLRADIIDHLPPSMQRAILRGGNRLPWAGLRPILPLHSAQQLCLASTALSRLA